MHVAPEVSSLDYTNAVTLQGFTIPAYPSGARKPISNWRAARVL